MMDESNGLYVLAANDIFHLLEQPEYAKIAAYVSFYEIYQGHLYDLLGSRKKLFAREDGNQNVVITGLTEYEVDSVDSLMATFEQGSLARSTGMSFRVLYSGPSINKEGKQARRAPTRIHRDPMPFSKSA